MDEQERMMLSVNEIKHMMTWCMDQLAAQGVSCTVTMKPVVAQHDSPFDRIAVPQQ